MDAATAKQKAYVRKLFVKCGTLEWVFNPLNLWNISKEDADLLINGLRILKDFDNGDLKEIIWLKIQGKNAIQKTTKTVDEMEEEQATYDPTCEDWLDQQTYSGIPQKEWIHEWRADMRKQEVIA